jgi:hypothetical protein
MNGRRAVFVLTIMCAVATVARSGHELPVYPSYYPHEIELSAVVPERAAELLAAGKIQAYVGSPPRFSGGPPATIESVESLGSFVLVRVNPESRLAGDGRSACAAVDAVVRDFRDKSDSFVLHPYPVTPFHGDYLHHVDRAEAEKARVLADEPAASAPRMEDLRVKAEGGIARSLVRSAWLAAESDWDVEVVETDIATLIASARYATNGWAGPPWIRSGWFHTYLLLSEKGGDKDPEHIKADLERLRTFDHDGVVERINLERSLVSTLAGSCRVRVAGYTVKREYFSTRFTAGIENIGYDSLTGFNSPMFIRTVKLKDFPWNGWLALGLDGRPSAAWNPIAGFGDDFGQLMWSAVGDAALIPSPYQSVWMLNRVTDVRSSARP